MKQIFKKIGIFYNTRHSNSEDIVNRLSDILNKNNIQTSINGLDPSICMHFSELSFIPDLIIIVGGDGTLLCAARNFAPKNIPLLGINSGYLGFLSQSSACALEFNIDKLLSGNFRVEERLMLRSFIENGETIQNFTALNDIVIKRSSLASPLILSVFVDGYRINDFLGDGLIISTPTGSTAYNLSVGGPIIVPSMEAIVLAPISSHSLAIRPIVIPDNKEVKIIMLNEPEKVILSADGQNHEILAKGSTIIVNKDINKAKLVLLGKEEGSFFNVLRSKLHWGIIPGNCPDVTEYNIDDL